MLHPTYIQTDIPAIYTQSPVPHPDVLTLRLHTNIHTTIQHTHSAMLTSNCTHTQTLTSTQVADIQIIPIHTHIQTSIQCTHLATQTPRYLPTHTHIYTHAHTTRRLRCAYILAHMTHPLRCSNTRIRTRHICTVHLLRPFLLLPYTPLNNTSTQTHSLTSTCHTYKLMHSHSHTDSHVLTFIRTPTHWCSYKDIPAIDHDTNTHLY